MVVDTGLFDETDFYDKLEAGLTAYQRRTLTGELAIEDWRYAVEDYQTTKVGMKDNCPGGPYQSPYNSRQLKGSLYIIWRDGRRTQVGIDRTAAEQFTHQIEVWRGVSYEDPEAAPVIEPQEYPEIKLLDEATWHLVVDGAPLFFDLLADRQKLLAKEYGVKILNAQISCARGRTTLRNSRGMNVVFYTTGCNLGISADHVYSMGFGKRRFPREDEIAHLTHTTGRIAGLLRNKATVASGRLPLLAPPAIAGGFYNTYIQNLDGGSILNRQSYFREKDFRKQRRIFRSDMNLVIDPLRELEYGSVPCSPEGVAARRAYLIEKGRFITPFLDLKYAGKAKMEPTPPGAILLKVDGAGAFQELVANTELGIMACSLLGLGSQDTSSGNYSCTVDQGLLIQNGRPVGRVKATVAGNFLRQISAAGTVFGYDQYEDNPGFCLETDVTVEKT